MELPHIGQACMVCTRTDYLPFKCTRCDKIVCIDHRTDHGTDCPLQKNDFVCDKSKNLESLKQACDHCKKITLKLELTRCNHCSGSHCLYHRHQVQHDCPKLEEDRKARQLNDAERVRRQQEALGNLKRLQNVTTSKPANLAPIQKAPQDLKKQALARRVRIMQIRQSARGPPGILDKEKIYFEVKFAHQPESTLSNERRAGKSVNIFATAKHSVGRLIDWAADELDVTNKNHTNDCDQLIFRKVETEQQYDLELDNQSTFQKYIESGQIDSGDLLYLTYKLMSRSPSR